MDLSQTETPPPQESNNHQPRRQNSVASKAEMIGPSEFRSQLDQITRNINVDQWKNIPMPVCQATISAFQCIDVIKRFVLFSESRFSNVQISQNQSSVEIKNFFDNFKTELEEQKAIFENAVEQRLRQVEQVIPQKVDKNVAQKLINKSEIKLQKSLDENVQDLQFQTKEQIIQSEQSQNQRLMNQLNHKLDSKFEEMKNLFNVEFFVGPQCQIDSYSSFVKQQLCLEKMNEERLNGFYSWSQIHQKELEQQQIKVLTIADRLNEEIQYNAKTFDQLQNSIIQKLTALENHFTLQLEQKVIELQKQNQFAEHFYNLQIKNDQLTNLVIDLTSRVHLIEKKLDKEINQKALNDKISHRTSFKMKRENNDSYSLNKVHQLQIPPIKLQQITDNFHNQTQQQHKPQIQEIDSKNLVIQSPKIQIPVQVQQTQLTIQVPELQQKPDINSISDIKIASNPEVEPFLAYQEIEELETKIEDQDIKKSSENLIQHIETSKKDLLEPVQQTEHYEQIKSESQRKISPAYQQFTSQEITNRISSQAISTPLSIINSNAQIKEPSENKEQSEWSKPIDLKIRTFTQPTQSQIASILSRLAKIEKKFDQRFSPKRPNTVSKKLNKGKLQTENQPNVIDRKIMAGRQVTLGESLQSSDNAMKRTPSDMNLRRLQSKARDLVSGKIIINQKESVMKSSLIKVQMGVNQKNNFQHRNNRNHFTTPDGQSSVYSSYENKSGQETLYGQQSSRQPGNTSEKPTNWYFLNGQQPNSIYQNRPGSSAAANSGISIELERTQSYSQDLLQKFKNAKFKDS